MFLCRTLCVCRAVLKSMLVLVRVCHIDINAGATPLYEAIANDQPPLVSQLVRCAKEAGTLQRLGHFDKFGNSPVSSLPRDDERRRLCAFAGLVSLPPEQYVTRFCNGQVCFIAFVLTAYEPSQARDLVHAKQPLLLTVLEEALAQQSSSPPKPSNQAHTKSA
jgi:hypothetical protein